ncbi:MAG: Stk1 family PASTA domain-containing Ser/Thr kinase [Emergencia sp.]
MSKLLAGRYELIEKIGEGGMAAVYKAKCRLLNRYVAIKILRPEFTKDAQFVENFKKESQAAAGLQHQNIVSVYDVGHEGNIHFIVMELIDGRPLSDIIEEKAPMDYKQCIEITKQVASALSLSHRNNIIHRDVKPHNIMITRDGIAKLADFGIAKAVSDSTLVTETSRVIGSVHYFSPEQARGAYVDERSDIYSLGIVLYEMLTGQVPFDGDNPVQVALMHINDEVTPPSKLVPGIPPALEKLVMKATDKFQSNRYRNAEELMEELDNIEFVTKMVGNSVFAAEDVEEYQEMNRRGELDADREPLDGIEKSGKKKKAKKTPKKTKEKEGGNKKGLIIAGVIAAVLIGTAVILYATGIIGGIRVPDVVGMMPDEAEKVLEEEGLKMKLGEEVKSDEVETGQIALQTPDEGEKASKGDTVTVMISAGKTDGTVPSVVGQDYDEQTIRATLAAAGYDLGTVERVESDAPENQIISQDPGSGASAEKGTRVNLTISKGTDKVDVPSLTGMTLEDATAELAKYGLSIGNVSYEESNVYAKDYIIRQSPGGGEKVKKDSAVDVVISKGEPEVIPPEDPGSDEPADEPDEEEPGENENNNPDEGA